MTVPSRRIGILAGGGTIPREIADSAAAGGVPVFIVALDGEADTDFAPHPWASVNWGQIGRMVSLFRAHGTTEIVIVGRVDRPDLGKVRPDLGLVMALPTIARIIRAGGDDAVLREVIRFFERRGFRVVGPADVAPGLIVGPGPLGAVSPGVDDARDIALGLEVVARLGPLDIGQGVVVSAGRIAAIEGVEGTDRMLARVGALRRAAGSGEAAASQGVREGVLIKRPKPGQELRVDLPAVGPETVTRVAEAGLHGIAVMAGYTVAAERGELVRRADAAGVFVAGIAGSLNAAVSGRSREAGLAAAAVEAHAGPRPTLEAVESARRGARVIAALAPYGVGLACVVVRRHVLAVEAGEGVPALLERVAALRQWGEARGRRRGVAVLAAAADGGAAIVEASAQAGLEGVVVVGATPPGELVAAAGRHGVFVGRVDAGGREGEHGKRS